jgi:hypothetical protein
MQRLCRFVHRVDILESIGKERLYGGCWFLCCLDERFWVCWRWGGYERRLAR